MQSDHQETWQGKQHAAGHLPLVFPLSALDRTSLSIGGGKAANLGELYRAGFAVPAGFCVTTAAYALVSVHAGLEPKLAVLATAHHDDQARLGALAKELQAAVLQAPIPANVVTAITDAYQALGQGVPVAVAVRSSATAEDLPSASFAGQQDTYLNLIGIAAVLRAVQQCWASLWTERATSYRASLGIDPRTVRLAVVVQRLVEAQVAGVLFTANPLTGKRRECVIEANPGLGEAVVSGATTPDHFVVKATSGEIVERRLSDKRIIIQARAGGGTQRARHAEPGESACLADEQLRALATLGAQVETHYGSPQDIEWAIDGDGHLWLLQARPITTLFPLPTQAPFTDEELRVYLSFGLQQGTARPFTPMGISVIRLLTAGMTALAGLPLPDPLRGPRFVTEAAARPFLDVTGALRSAFGRRLLVQMMAEAEVQAAASLQHLTSDPRLSLLKTPRRAFLRSLAFFLLRSGMLWYLLQALLAPTLARRRVQRLVSRLRRAEPLAAADTAAHLAAVERLLLYDAPRLLPRVSPVMVIGMQTLTLAKRLLGSLATEEECQVVLRGSPTNPTVEMNLALWALAEEVGADPATARLVQETSSAQLAQEYHAGHLPAALQQGTAAFLATYGHHAVAELDLGLPRWAENPTPVFSSLVSYLPQIASPARAPHAQLRQMQQEAEEMAAELTRRARRKSWLRGRLVGFCLKRAHALAGFREMPRFAAALLLAQARALLWPVGEKLAQAGQLEAAEDVFFITLPEAHAALAGTDLRAVAQEQRASYAQELTRRHVPLVLLSDGTEPTSESAQAGTASDALQGTPASPGRVMARARVILDPDDAHLEPGEILVAPSTDPGWTPLFLTAGGLVMEMGGAMAHGAIVAREYGIPAVVGVAGAATRIRTGQQITIDGSLGTVTFEFSRP